MNKSIDDCVRLFSSVSDPTRLRLLALCSAGEFSVSDLTRVLDQSQPRVSRHLKLLATSGLLERFRDGHFVYFRVPRDGEASIVASLVLKLVPSDSTIFRRDIERANAIRPAALDAVAIAASTREFNRALMDFAQNRPLGRLLVIGIGSGRVMSVLGKLTREVVGLDRDPAKRQFARRRMLAAGLANFSVRDGWVDNLPFDDNAFDTVVIDEVLGRVEQPQTLLAQTTRVLKNDGRVLIVRRASAYSDMSDALEATANWCKGTHLQLSAPRAVPALQPDHYFFAGVTKPALQGAA